SLTPFIPARLPAFKPFPAEFFTEAEWTDPPFLEGETFEIKEESVVALEDDPSLSGLVAKRLVSETASGKVEIGGSNPVADKAVISLAGGDQRENAMGGVAKSVAISEVSGREETLEPDNDAANKIIIAVVAIAFIIILVATGLYFYKNHETDLDDDGGDDDRKKRSRRKRKSGGYSDISDE
ncbi:hypothetical protein EGW08_010520, partial [Elysia chlorotica]